MPYVDARPLGASPERESQEKYEDMRRTRQVNATNSAMTEVLGRETPARDKEHSEVLTGTLQFKSLEDNDTK